MTKALLVVGASSDIGLELIRSVHEKFDHLIAHYNSDSVELEILKEKIGEKLQLHKADFSSEEETINFVEFLKENYSITHMVHLPAKPMKYNNFHKSKWTNLERDLQISLRSIYYITNGLIKTMSRNEGGKIVVLLSSVTAVVPRFTLDYTTSKYALLGFVKALAVEYAEKNICVNAVSPSMIETKFVQDIPRMVIEKSAEDNPMKRNAMVEDVVPIIQFLLSEESNYITGQNVVVSGGSVI